MDVKNAVISKRRQVTASKYSELSNVSINKFRRDWN